MSIYWEKKILKKQLNQKSKVVKGIHSFLHCIYLGEMGIENIYIYIGIGYWKYQWALKTYIYIYAYIYILFVLKNWKKKQETNKSKVEKTRLGCRGRRNKVLPCICISFYTVLISELYTYVTNSKYHLNKISFKKWKKQ